MSPAIGRLPLSPRAARGDDQAVRIVHGPTVEVVVPERPASPGVAGDGPGGRYSGDRTHRDVRHLVGHRTAHIPLRLVRCDVGGAPCAVVPGATGQTYTLTTDDAGHRLRVRVTAKNMSGSIVATSPPTAVVARAPATTTTTTTTTLPATAEVCGNCADDDGNGLADDLDPACCAGPVALRVRRATFVGPRGDLGSARLLLRLVIDGPGAGGDPTAAPVRLQVAGDDGMALCATLAGWTRKGRRFRHRGRAPGVTRAVLSTGNAAARLTVRGSRVDLGTLAGSELTVAVRVGAWCARGAAPLVRKGRRLVARP